MVKKNIKTHQGIDQRFCGNPVIVEPGQSQVERVTTESMTIDDSGLIHGGFLFGLADHAAMIAVNHPNVVLGSADVIFLKPVQKNHRIVAKATVQSVSGKKQMVSTTITRGLETVFKGEFTCFVLEQHVLEGDK
jgi:acyl-coenzyme A thioesterase PaaI-like protein